MRKRNLVAAILPDRRFDVAATQSVCGFNVGSHLVSFVEMKLALSREEENQCTFRRGNVRQMAVASVPERDKRRE